MVLKDIGTAATLGALAAIDFVCPDSQIERVMARLAKVHIALRGSNAHQLVAAGIDGYLDLDCRELEQSFLAGVYREMLYTMRHKRGGSWLPEIQLHGEQYLANAVSNGRGVVLWGWACTYGGLLSKRCLHEHGYQLAMLASHAHPYSGSPFGMKYLNPVRTRLEDLYLSERVTIQPGAETVAMRRVLQILQNDGIVEISATGTGNSVASMPFLGGNLNLALGAPTLAAMSGAELIPLACIPRDSGGFDIHIEPPLQHESGQDSKAFAQCAAEQYAKLVQGYVERAPHVWRGWFNRSNWSPE